MDQQHIQNIDKDLIVIDHNQNEVEFDGAQFISSRVLHGTIIDLTSDDDEPAVKQRLTDNGPSTSSRSTTIGGRKNAAGTSSSFGIRKCSACSTRSSGIEYVVLDCDHSICKFCFRIALLNKAFIVKCAEPGCGEPFSDGVIKATLDLEDYVVYLERLRDFHRKALQQYQPNYQFEDLLNPFAGSFDDDSLSSPLPPVQRSRSLLINHLNLDSMSYVPNSSPFECSICFDQIAIGDGVVLKSCIHTFCLQCLRDTINYSDDQVVKCPHNSDIGTCEFFLEPREIRGILEEEDHEKHLAKALKRAETVLDNGVHCKTPNCVGFVEIQEGSAAFNCPICDKINCIKCKVVHEDKSCEQYQADLLLDAKNQRELQETEEAVKKMLEKGEVSC